LASFAEQPYAKGTQAKCKGDGITFTGARSQAVRERPRRSAEILKTNPMQSRSRRETENLEINPMQSLSSEIDTPSGTQQQRGRRNLEINPMQSPSSEIDATPQHEWTQRQSGRRRYLEINPMQSASSEIDTPSRRGKAQQQSGQTNLKINPMQSPREDGCGSARQISWNNPMQRGRARKVTVTAPHPRDH